MASIPRGKRKGNKSKTLAVETQSVRPCAIWVSAGSGDLPERFYAQACNSSRAVRALNLRPDVQVVCFAWLDVSDELLPDMEAGYRVGKRGLPMSSIENRLEAIDRKLSALVDGHD